MPPESVAAKNPPGPASTDLSPGAVVEALGQRGSAYAVELYTSLDAIPADVLCRIAYSEQGDIFLSADWFRCLAAHGFPTELRPRVYVANDARGAPTCFLFCATEDHGRTLYGLSNFYTMEFAATFVNRQLSDPRILGRLAQHIAMERPRWHRISLTFLRADRFATDFLANAFAAEGFVINRYFQYQNWYCNTDRECFDDYYKRRPSRLKNTIKRKEKKLRREHVLEIRIHVEVSDQLIADWEAIYANSWKDKEQFPEFMPNFMRLCAALGLLRFGILYVDGEPAAGQIWITSRWRAMIYKLAYDEKYASWSVGSILTRDMMRHALDHDGVVEVDYGVGSEAHKRDWTTGCREIIGIEGLNSKSFVGLCFALKLRLFETAKRLLLSLRTSCRSTLPPAGPNGLQAYQFTDRLKSAFRRASYSSNTGNQT